MRWSVVIACVVLTLGVIGEASARSARHPMLLGVFPNGALTNPAALTELAQIDGWTSGAGGARTSIAGTFIDLEVGFAEFNVIEQLERAWQAGYTPMAVITAQRTAAALATGAADNGITSWARAYAIWVQRGGGRVAFLAPLPEANYFASAIYALDPENFQRAFRRIVDAFTREGVHRRGVRWIFAPNAFTEPGHPEFEEYYPGDAYVDGIGFSQYNWGYCTGSRYDTWLDPTLPGGAELFDNYFARMRALAPGLPIFVLQTATTAQSPARGQIDDQRKSEWLRNAYRYFADEDAAGVIYFNIDKECDWALFRPGAAAYLGYQDATRDPDVGYIAPEMLSKLDLGQTSVCTASSTRLCLQGGRFQVEVRWRDPITGQIARAAVVPERTTDSGLFRFWDPNNWEVLVKVLDGCGANGNNRFWVYSAAATDLEYTLVVTDTATGQSRSYTNPSGHRAEPVLDVTAFATCGVATSSVADASDGGLDGGPDDESAGGPVSLDDVTNGDGDDGGVAVDATAAAAAAASCQPTATAACLQQQRFRVAIDWRRGPTSALEQAVRSPVGTSDSTIFTFYGTQNWEILVKVLNGCGANGNGRFWVFGAAATDREFDIHVTDTRSGSSWTWHNGFGVVPQAIADVDAFATCP